MQWELELKNSGFSGDVLLDDETLKKYSHDASVCEVRPECVVFPKNANDIKILVRWVNSQKSTNPTLSITVRAAGTCMSGGSLNESIIVDVTRYMNRLDPVDLPTKTIRTDPGVFYRDFEKATLAQGLLYPAFPASKDICAMGGIVGNNGAGEKTLRYGQAHQYIKQLSVVFLDGNEYDVRPLSRGELDVKMAQGDYEGNLYKSVFEMLEKNYEAVQKARPTTSKNAAGYALWNVWNRETGIFDMTKLIVGSQGTLGIVTSATFSLVPVEPHSAMLALYVYNRSQLATLVKLALQEHPESVEAFDDKTVRLAFGFWRGFIKLRGFFGAARLGLSLLPDLVTMLRGGIPTMVLLVNFTGTSAEAVRTSAARLEAQLHAAYPDLAIRRALSARSSDKYWTIRHDAFKLLRDHYKGMRTVPFIDDVIVDPMVFPEFLPKLESILDQYKLVYNIHGHAGNGNFHVIPLMDMSRSDVPKIISEVADQVYDLVLSYGGSLTAEHNDGIVRTPYLQKQFGNFITGLFRQTKTLFDPETVLNPGKKVGGTKEYFLAHLNRS